ncbi:hypothetical protein PIB30_039777 [Stylosanthes scabra]|uniref:Uncharacterized protein n=1 Tax=Stylosanthes scabra TaxID=79078 RepID=A0ABU6WFI6_9FABA|nr:hypothetical protein [Stylosanthes scabra]
MEDLSMFQRPRTIALEDENPGTYGTTLIYPLDRLVECGFVGDTVVNPWVGIFCRREGFAKESESLMRIRESRINLVATPRAERSSSGQGSQLGSPCLPRGNFTLHFLKENFSRSCLHSGRCSRGSPLHENFLHS